MFKKEWIIDKEELIITFKYGKMVHTYWAPNKKVFEEKVKLLKEKDS